MLTPAPAGDEVARSYAAPPMWVRACRPVVELAPVTNWQASTPMPALPVLWMEAARIGNWSLAGGWLRAPPLLDSGTLNSRIWPDWPLLRQWPAVRKRLAQLPLLMSQPVQPTGKMRPWRASFEETRSSV